MIMYNDHFPGQVHDIAEKEAFRGIGMLSKGRTYNCFEVQKLTYVQRCKVNAEISLKFPNGCEHFSILHHCVAYWTGHDCVIIQMARRA